MVIQPRSTHLVWQRWPFFFRAYFRWLCETNQRSAMRRTVAARHAEFQDALEEGPSVHLDPQIALGVPIVASHYGSAAVKQGNA